jgi:hypothetical protein
MISDLCEFHGLKLGDERTKDIERWENPYPSPILCAASMTRPRDYLPIDCHLWHLSTIPAASAMETDRHLGGESVSLASV